jgi:hypothetical protein
VAKTGLGSSAALITSLVTALLVQTRLIAPTELASAPARRLAHNVAQFVHCLAQGKVGSGFDVSSAVFGSQLYTRFSPAVLQPLMDNIDSARTSLSLALSISLLRPNLTSLLISSPFFFAGRFPIASICASAGEFGVGSDGDAVHASTAHPPAARRYSRG